MGEPNRVSDSKVGGTMLVSMGEPTISYAIHIDTIKGLDTIVC